MNLVRDILQNYIPNYEVWAFGSRVNGRAKLFSDLDVAIITQNPLSFKLNAELSDAFSESDLP